MPRPRRSTRISASRRSAPRRNASSCSDRPRPWCARGKKSLDCFGAHAPRKKQRHPHRSRAPDVAQRAVFRCGALLSRGPFWLHHLWAPALRRSVKYAAPRPGHASRCIQAGRPKTGGKLAMTNHRERSLESSSDRSKLSAFDPRGEAVAEIVVSRETCELLALDLEPLGDPRPVAGPVPEAATHPSRRTTNRHHLTLPGGVRRGGPACD